MADGIDLNDRESLIAAQGEHFRRLICAGPDFDTVRERMSRIGYHRSRLEGPVQNRLNDAALKLFRKLEYHLGDCCNCARGGHYCDKAMRRVRKALKRVSRDNPTEAPERLVLALIGVLGHVEEELYSVRVELNKTRRMVARPLI